MKCEYCGSEMQEGQNFCDNCGPGGRLISVSRCNVCGEAVHSSMRYCPRCGSELEPHPVPEPHRSPKNEKKLYILIGCLIVAIALAIGTLLVVNVKNEKEYYNDLVTMGNKYFEALEYEKAEATFLEAIAIDPKQEDVYVYLSYVYTAQGEYDKAISILEEGKEILTSDLIEERLQEVVEESTRKQEEDKKRKEEIQKEKEEEKSEEQEIVEEPQVTVQDFLEDKGYLEYQEYFEDGTADSYAILDINQDGIDELLMRTGQWDVFESFCMFAVVDNEIQFIDDFTSCYGISYSEHQKCLAFTDARPSAQGGNLDYYTYENGTMQFIYSVFWELDMSRYEEVYTKRMENGESIGLTSSEYEELKQEFREIEFINL